MTNILDEIVAQKRTEVAAILARGSYVERTESLARSLPPRPPVRSFSAALRRPGMRIIAEVKKASPSAGVIRADFDPVAIARTYADNGADCLSILTDETFFHGSLDYLRQVRTAVGLPLLRKEFILDPVQIAEARAAGADCVLLIAEILPGDELARLHACAVDYGLEVLVELHDAWELPRVLACGAKIVGINNRDLRTFQTSLSATLDLLPGIPSDVLVVSESGIRTHDDIVTLGSAGVKAVLVGESLMRQPDIGRALRELLRRG